MPSKPPVICSCGSIVVAGARCPCRRQYERDRHARSDSMRASSSARGYTSTWEAARARFLREHGLCDRCGADADTVNHRIPHRGNASLFWDVLNWEAVCRHCHDSVIQREERRALLEATQ